MALVIAIQDSLRRRLENEVGSSAVLGATDSALGLGGVNWIPISDNADRAKVDDSHSASAGFDFFGECSEEDDGDEVWNRRFRHLLMLPQGDLVFIVETKAPGKFSEVIGDMKSFVRKAAIALQADRVLPPIGAIVVIAHAGISESDGELLEKCAFGASPEDDKEFKEIAGSHGRPCYLLNYVTRATAGGIVGSVAECWPTEVSRLLASLSTNNKRDRGLYAWRSISFNPSAFRLDDCQIQTLRIARQVMRQSPVKSTEAHIDSVSLKPMAPPTKKVASDMVPQHCRDKRSSLSLRPSLPEWIKLDPSGSSENATNHAKWRTDTTGGLNSTTKSEWYQRFEDRGSRFVDERFEKSFEALESVSGPHSVQANVWLKIHSDPASLRWFAYGYFIHSNDGELRLLETDLLSLLKLGERETKVRDERESLLIRSKEVDRARSHFLAIWPRIACAAAAALFVGVAYGLAVKSLNITWTIGIGLIAPTGAFLGAIVLFFLELIRGNQARNAIEDQLQSVEREISQLYGERLERGALSDLRARRIQWLQTASKAKDTALRLLNITELCEGWIFKRLGNGVEEEKLSSWRRLTSIEPTDPILIETLVDDLFRLMDGDIQSLQEQFRSWWSQELEREDPDCTGAVRLQTFGPRYRRRLTQLLDVCRLTLIQSLASTYSERAGDVLTSRALYKFLGAPSDFAGLGCRTRLAVGRPINRVVHVHCCLPSHLKSSVLAVTDYYGGGVSVAGSVSPVDQWGMVGLLLEEIPISLRGTDLKFHVENINSDVKILSIWEGFLNPLNSLGVSNNES